MSLCNNYSKTKEPLIFLNHYFECLHWSTYTSSVLYVIIVVSVYVCMIYLYDCIIQCSLLLYFGWSDSENAASDWLIIRKHWEKGREHARALPQFAIWACAVRRHTRMLTSAWVGGQILLLKGARLNHPSLYWPRQRDCDCQPWIRTVSASLMCSSASCSLPSTQLEVSGQSDDTLLSCDLCVSELVVSSDYNLLWPISIVVEVFLAC